MGMMLVSMLLFDKQNTGRCAHLHMFIHTHRGRHTHDCLLNTHTHTHTYTHTYRVTHTAIILNTDPIHLKHM